MEDFLNNISSPSWWIGVVIVGLLINFISEYSKPVFDKVSSRFLESRRRAVEEKRRAFEQAVESLAQHPEEVLALKVDILFYNLRAVLVVVVGILVTSLVSIGFIGFLFDIISFVIRAATLGFALSYISRERCARMLLTESENRKGIQQPSQPSGITSG